MSASPSRAIKLFGTDEPPARSRLLRAGPLSAELDDGNLRYVRFHGLEAIRAISYVVRDQYWGTFGPTLSDLAVSESGDAFTVTYTAQCGDAGQSFRYEVQITGSADGRLVFSAHGSAQSDFLTNRTGFVVLHPASLAGRPVELLDVNATRVSTAFPQRIDPKQPIMDIRALTHEIVPGLRVTCTMDGDTFEMEDQRNWTDASFKTYVRPIGLPFPYTLAAGEALEQSVTLAFEGARAAGSVTSGAEAAQVRVAVGEASGRMPAFGMAVEPRYLAASLEHGELLGRLRPAFLSCYHDSRQRADREAFARLAALGSLLGAELALEEIVTGEAPPVQDLARTAELARDAGATFASVAVSRAADLDFVMPGTVFDEAREFDELFAAARQAFEDARIGGGNLVYFTELNRRPPPHARLDFVCHATCAIVHAADDRSVIETLECLPHIVESARASFGDLHYRVGPGSIGSRNSPFGSEPPANPRAIRMTMTRADPRQRGLLGAAWHVGYAARMAECGVDSVILGAPVGEFGLVFHPGDFAQPGYDDGAGALYPVYHAMREIYAASSLDRLPCEVSSPERVQALAWRSGDSATVLLANLTGVEQAVALSGAALESARVCVLDEDSFEACAAHPDGFDNSTVVVGGRSLMLGPYAVARIQVPAARP